jgi:hypothetical protein
MQAAQLQALRQRYAFVSNMMQQIDSELEVMQQAFSAAQQSIGPRSINSNAWRGC